MGIMRFNYRSEILGRYVDVSVAYPTDSYRCPPTEAMRTMRAHRAPAPEKPVYRPGMKFQTVYLIHGGGDDDTLTYRYSNVEEAAQRNHVMLVTPDIANSFGADTRYGVAYMTFLTEELPTVVQALFASSPAREDNFIMGYAMGGNAALGAAVNRPDRYAVCVDISGGIGMTLRADTLAAELEGEHFKSFFPLYNHTFGPPEEVAGSPADLRAQVLRRRAQGGPECKFIVVCGSREFIRARVEDDVAAMRELGMDVQYLCAQGYDHDFRLWDRYLQFSLDHLLPLRRAAIDPKTEKE